MNSSTLCTFKWLERLRLSLLLPLDTFRWTPRTPSLPLHSCPSTQILFFLCSFGNAYTHCSIKMTRFCTSAFHSFEFTFYFNVLLYLVNIVQQTAPWTCWIWVWPTREIDEHISRTSRPSFLHPYLSISFKKSSILPTYFVTYAAGSL